MNILFWRERENVTKLLFVFPKESSEFASKNNPWMLVKPVSKYNTPRCW